MLSYRDARLIQRSVYDEFEIFANIYDSNRLLAGDVSRYLPSITQLNDEYIGESSGRLITVMYRDSVLCYLMCSRDMSPDESRVISMFVRTILHSGKDRRPSFHDSVFREESLLLQRILSDRAALYSNDILTSASALGYNLNHPMLVIVAYMEQIRNYNLNLDLGYERSSMDAKQNILSILKNHRYFSKEDLISIADDDYLVILKAVQSAEDRETLYKVQQGICGELDKILKPYKLFIYYIAGGCIADSMEKAYDSYRMAQDSIQYARKTDLSHSVVTANDTLFHSIASSLPDEYLVTVIEPVVSEMLKENPETIRGLIICFDAYIDNGFRIAQTAQDEYMHRNTVKKRLDKLKNLTGFDPMGSFNDILMNRLIILRYLEERAKG